MGCVVCVLCGVCVEGGCLLPGVSSSTVRVRRVCVRCVVCVVCGVWGVCRGVCRGVCGLDSRLPAISSSTVT